MINDCTVIVLAAGYSHRLGEDKTQLDINGSSLLDYWEKLFSDNKIAYLSVVSQLCKNKQHRIVNVNNRGLGSSIAAAMASIKTTYVLIHLCDNYRFDLDDFVSLVELAKNNPHGISCVKHDDVISSPSVFHKTYYPKLKQLSGDVGPKHLLKNALFYQSSKAMNDIDTAKDLLEFNHWKENKKCTQ